MSDPAEHRGPRSSKRRNMIGLGSLIGIVTVALGLIPVIGAPSCASIATEDDVRAVDAKLETKTTELSRDIDDARATAASGDQALRVEMGQAVESFRTEQADQRKILIDILRETRKP